jgi:hypothetical protein
LQNNSLAFPFKRRQLAFPAEIHTVSKKATFGLSNLSNSVLMTNLASIVAALNAGDH